MTASDRTPVGAPSADPTRDSDPRLQHTYARTHEDGMVAKGDHLADRIAREAAETRTSPSFSSPETAALVLGYLQENPTASLRTIASAVGIGRNTAHTAIARLVADGSVRVARLGTGNRYPTRYEVTA